MKFSLLILLVFLFSCQKNASSSEQAVQENPSPDTSVKVVPRKAVQAFVQSDSVLLGEKRMKDGSIRKDNFHLDIDAHPEDLPSLYRAYDVEHISKSHNIYLIKTKQLYRKARTFFRLIRFDKKGNQVAARTFVDYRYLNLIKVKNGYALGLENPIPGIDWDENARTYQLLFLDKNFKTRIQKLPCPSSRDEILKLSLINDTVNVSVRVYLGCTICYNAMMHYQAQFSKEGDFVGGKILSHSNYPKGDSTLFEKIKGCLQ
ncbi:MAG: hypothetical protein AB8F95_14930 [Bacteroidia bacterium]